MDSEIKKKDFTVAGIATIQTTRKTDPSCIVNVIAPVAAEESSNPGRKRHDPGKWEVERANRIIIRNKFESKACLGDLSKY